MERQYELYCIADPLFYDAPDQGRARSADFAVASRELPGGWRQVDKGEWLVYVPEIPIPAQGWKIHVSGCLDNAEDLLAEVWDYCIPRQVAFKFLRNRRIAHIRSAKYAPRGASGKLATIYPRDDSHCELICTELGARLAGQPGPYILSDLRIGDGPLYVRYGAFQERHCEDETGQLVPALEDANGTLVPDRRGAVFTVPAWVTLPDFAAPHLATRNSITLTDLPYHFDAAMHYSNGGGVYLATDLRSEEKVVIKEGRPHAGLGADASDAVTRLQRERDVLTRLDGLDVVPKVRDYFERGGHHFLVQEFIEGESLNNLFAPRHPYLDPAPDPERIADYTAWALRIHAAVERAVAAIHERGVVFNDLHVFNVMVRPDETVALIDFEAATYVDEGRRLTVGNPGFAAPRDRTGFAIDRYSLACMRLAMFVPLTMLIPLDRAKAAHLVEVIGELFPAVDREFLAEAAREIIGDADLSAPRFRLPRLAPDPPGWERARDALRRSILASATPSRDDRLFPGDVRQVAPGGGLGLGYGAAGVLYALWMATGERHPEYEDWIVQRATAPVEGTPLGLYDGLLGVAYVLERLGRRDAALQVAEIVLGERWDRLGLDLHGGLSGAALVFAHLGAAAGDAVLRDASLRATDIVASRIEQRQAADAAGQAEHRAGLLYGATGAALLLVRQYERTGDAGHLDAAGSALRHDLERCVVDRNGALQVDEGWRTMPYFGIGSVGIGSVLDDYLAHRDDERFAEAATRAKRAAASHFYAEPGLFRGRAGLMLALSREHAPGTAFCDPRVSRHVQPLAWHATAYGGGLAFPGSNLYRLSMDLGTGTAGVLLALAAALSTRPACLPFLEPTETRIRRPSVQLEISATRR